MGKLANILAHQKTFLIIEIAIILVMEYLNIETSEAALFHVSVIVDGVKDIASSIKVS